MRGKRLMKKRFWVLVSMAVLSVCLMGCGRTYSLNDYYRLLSSDWHNDKEPIDEKEYQAENDSLEAEEESMESIGDADYYHTIEDAMNIFKKKNE